MIWEQTPSGCYNSLCVIAKMSATHKRDFLQKVRILLSLLRYFDFHYDLQTEKEEFETTPPSALQATPSSQPTSPTRRRRKPQNSWVTP